MSGKVLSSQSLISQNLPVAIPQAPVNNSNYAVGLITTVQGSPVASGNLPSGTRINVSANALPPTIIISPYTVSSSVPSAYVYAYNASNIAIAPTAGGNWSGVYTYKYTLLNEF
jgi:hypothetical protein